MVFFRRNFRHTCMNKISILTFVFFCGAMSAFAQSSFHWMGIEGQSGWILAHNPELREVSKSRPFAMNLSSQWMKTTRKNWESCNCFHYLGLNLSVLDFQNPRELGRAWNLSGSFEPVLFRGQRWSFSLSSGIGISHLTRLYDPIQNPRNTFFSAPISFLLFVSPKVTWEFASDWALQGSFSYGHISNGGQRQPNRGMNFPLFGFGILHYTHKADFPEYAKNPIPKDWSVYTDLALNTQDSGNGNRRPNFALALGAFRQLTGIIGMGGGLEVAKDFSLPVQESRVEALIPGAFLANHFLFGRFDFSQRMVKYLYKPKGYQEEYLYYQRYLLSYRLGRNFRVGAGLKAHGHTAEFMDFRVGWVF